LQAAFDAWVLERDADREAKAAQEEVNAAAEEARAEAKEAKEAAEAEAAEAAEGEEEVKRDEDALNQDGAEKTVSQQIMMATLVVLGVNETLTQLKGMQVEEATKILSQAFRRFAAVELRVVAAVVVVVVGCCCFGWWWLFW
jgi:uncharacterized membrane protein YdbT with pleckstrin-like domain